MEEKAPVFIKVDEYRQVLDVIDKLKQQIDGVHATLAEIRSLRSQEADYVDEWEQHVAEVEQKIIEIDKALFEPDM